MTNSQPLWLDVRYILEHTPKAVLSNSSLLNGQKVIYYPLTLCHDASWAPAPCQPYRPERLESPRKWTHKALFKSGHHNDEPPLPYERLPRDDLPEGFDAFEPMVWSEHAVPLPNPLGNL